MKSKVIMMLTLLATSINMYAQSISGKLVDEENRPLQYANVVLLSLPDSTCKELPGLRGFSATSLKKMRLFYDNWIMNLVSLRFSNITDFPVEDFFRIPFTHHVEIYSRVKGLNARYYYIHRTSEEKLSIDRLKKIINDDAYEHQASIPNNFPHTLPNAIMARKAVMMFKDEYLLDFINVEEIGERESIDIDERVVEKQIVENGYSGCGEKPSINECVVKEKNVSLSHTI